MNVITAYATLSKLIKTLTGVVTDFSYDSANKAIKLTTTTGTYSIPTSQIIVSSVKGDPGQDGKSAYEIAVDHGYSGTEEEWIKNLGSSFDDSALQTAINKNKTDISNLSTDLINSQSIISQNTSKISKNTTDITTIKSDLSDAVSDVATNKSDISNLKTNINKIGDLTTLQTTDKTSIINAINELNSKFMQSMTYSNKKLTITYKNGLTFDIDLSSIITDTNIGELSNVNDTGITDKQTLIFDAASNKYIPGTIDTSQTLKDAKDYTDKQIAAISHADAIQCDEKPSLSGDTVTYKKGGATQTTTNLNTWFYYQDAEGNWQQTIFIDGVEVTIAMTGVDLTDYVSKSKDVVSTYTGTEVDKNKVVDIAALDALKALINTDLSKKINTTDIVDALTSNATDKPLSANQGSVIKTELDKKANTTDMNTELAKKINTADIIDNLTSTDTSKPLSANQGKVLKAEADKKINKTDIVNNLTSTNTDKPLSANQGKVLDDKKLNKTDVDKITMANVDNVNIKDYILENCTDENKIYYIAARSNCTELPKVSSNYYMIVQKVGSYTIKVTTKELASSNNEYVCTYRTDNAKWSNWEKVLVSSNISTTIDSTSTDDTVPTNKAVYDSIKNKNTIQPTGTITNYSTIFDWAVNNVGASCGYEGNMFDDCPLPNTWGTLVCIGTKAESGLKVLFCTNFNKDIYTRTIQRRNGVNDWVTSWEKVCTTSVADVPSTDIIFTNTTNYSIANNANCRYFVENGICTMILHVRCNTPYGWVTVADNIPKPRKFHCYQMLSSLDGTSFMRCTIRTSGKIELSRGVADTEYIGSFSYPVAES